MSNSTYKFSDFFCINKGIIEENTEKPILWASIGIIQIKNLHYNTVRIDYFTT